MADVIETTIIEHSPGISEFLPSAVFSFGELKMQIGELEYIDFEKLTINMKIYNF
jgi:hypothetical protein